MLAHSILEHGQRDPIIVWKQTGYILDGHNRFEILTKLKRKPKSQNISLPDQQAAEMWILTNQLARRNLHPNHYAYYLGKKYEAEKTVPGKNDQGSQLQRVAEQSGKAEKTIRLNANFANGVDKLEAAMPGMRKRILNGASAATKTIIGALGKDKTATVEKLKAIVSKKRRKPTAVEKAIDAHYKSKHKDPFLDIYPFIDVLEWADKSKSKPTPIGRIREYFEEDISGNYHKKNNSLATAIKLLTSYQEKL